MSGENWDEYPDDPDRACIFGRRPRNHQEAMHHLWTALRVVKKADAQLAEVTAERDQWMWVAQQLAECYPDETIDKGFDHHTGEDYGDINPWDEMIMYLIEDPDCPFPDDDPQNGWVLADFLDKELRNPLTKPLFEHES